ncbi:MAG TPA: DUF4209 domain-containing protein, partial [Pyrinomonadaceae bacterium]
YAKAAKEAEEKGDGQGAAVFCFLQIISSFGLSVDTPAAPFVPLWSSPAEGRRSLIPSDLTPNDIEVVKTLSKRTSDPALAARLYDVIWEMTNDHLAVGDAARYYSLAAEKLDVSDDWFLAVVSFRRGLYLAAKLGRDKELFRNSADSLLKAAKRAAGNTEKFHCGRLMELMLNLGLGDPVEFASLSLSIAEDAKKKGEVHVAKAYWQIEAGWHKRAKDFAAEKKARLAAANASVSEAEAHAKGEGASFLAAASLMAKAIEEQRRAGASKEKISELRSRLNDWQEKSLSEFKSISTEIDISKLVEGARDHVRGNAFLLAVLKLAFGPSLSEPSEIRDEVINNAKQTPLLHSIGAAIIDQRGRPAARKESLFGLKGEALEEAIEAESFSQAAQFHWPLRVDGFIGPARIQILNDHKPTFEDLLFIVRDNPFIPPGHEGIFLRGLHAGFHGDFLAASHLLPLQIENSLRYVLESQGVDISNLMSDGTQPVKVLGAIFGMAETTKIFGEALCFELRGCLIEKTGYDFRNRVAHGFVHDGECHSTAPVMLWWLVLRICLMPIFQSLEEGQPSAPPAEPPIEPTLSSDEAGSPIPEE